MRPAKILLLREKRSLLAPHVAAIRIDEDMVGQAPTIPLALERLQAVERAYRRMHVTPRAPAPELYFRLYAIAAIWDGAAPTEWSVRIWHGDSPAAWLRSRR